MHLLKAALTMFAVMAVAVVATAQEEYPKAEIAMGYSLVRYSTTGPLEQFTANGGSTSIAYNFNRKIGLVADFGGYNNNNIRGFDVDNTMFTYLFGPRFTARGEHVNVFGHAMFGGAHISGSASSLLVPTPVGGSSATTGFEESNNSAAFLIGGGFDVHLSKHFALRPAQFDYLLIRFNPKIAGVEQSSTQNNLRYSAQIVFKFGN
jgi:outer membrane protein with beta-barrel domain